MGLSARRLTVFGNYVPDANNSMMLYAELLSEAAMRAGFASVGHARPHVLFGHAGERLARLKWLTTNLDKFFVAPLLLARADVLHIADHANAVYLAAAHARATLVTCHDLIPFLCMYGELEGWRPSHSGSVILDHIAKGLRRADHVVCVSAATRADLIRITGVAPEKTSLIPNCLRTDLPRLSAEDARAELALLGVPEDAPAVLSFGTAFYKNRFGALAMFAAARPHLPRDAVLVSIGPPDEALRDRARVLGCANRILMPWRVSSRQIAALYAGASVLLFPSLYEGFGYPLIEAQSFGLPVIASTAGPLPEVAGDGAILIGPEDIQAGGDAITRIFHDESLRAGLIARGHANAARFGFPAWAAAYRALYERLLA